MGPVFYKQKKSLNMGPIFWRRFILKSLSSGVFAFSKVKKL